MGEKEIGKVIHYFDKAMVAVVRLEGKLAVGDTIRVARSDSDFTMEIASMQIEHVAVPAGKKGDEVAIKVSEPTKDGAKVFKVSA